MEFTLKISMDNDSFVGHPGELGKIVYKLSERLLTLGRAPQKNDEGILNDSNGNTVGSWKIE